MTKCTSCFILLASLYAAVVAAQEPEQKLTMPGPEIQNLMLGKWSIKVHYPSSEKPNGDTGQGTETWRPGPGGRSVIEEYREKNSKGEVEGLGLAWWDKDAQGQRFVWCESDLPSGCYVSKAVAKWEGENLVWKEEQEVGGAKTAYAETFREITPGSFVQELQEGENLQNLRTTAMITASRIKTQAIMTSDAPVSDTEFRTAMSKRHQAMIDGDEAVVDRLTAKEYAQTDILGHVQDKSAWMAEYFRPLAALIKAGKFRWERYDERDVRIVMLGETAVVTGELTMKGTGAKFTQGKWEEAPARSIEGTLRFTRVWIKRDGAWLLVALHNSAPLGVQTSRP